MRMMMVMVMVLEMVLAMVMRALPSLSLCYLVSVFVCKRANPVTSWKYFLSPDIVALFFFSYISLPYKQSTYFQDIPIWKKVFLIAAINTFSLV